VNDCELLTLQDVTDKARLLTGDSDSVFSEKYIKQKLIERYGEHIQFSEVRGRRNLICWKQMASFMVNQKWYNDQKRNAGEHIVVTAAKLLRATIRGASYNTDFYPSTADVQDTDCANQWLPSLLQLFMHHLICPSVKKTAVGHYIVQAVRPKTTVAPIPFALGLQ